MRKEPDLHQCATEGLDPESCEIFWKTWKLHHEYLFGLCLRWTRGNRADAEDALSQAKMKALAAYFAKPEAKLDEKAWLSRVLYTVCMDQHRRRSRRERLNGGSLHEEAFQETVHPAGAPSPEELLLGRELHARLERLAAELPPSWHRALVERVVRERTYGDIAAEHGTTEANIRKRVQLARAYLRRRLTREVPE